MKKVIRWLTVSLMSPVIALGFLWALLRDAFMAGVFVYKDLDL